MAKVKRELRKNTTTPKLKDKIVKRKSLKKSAAITPKLKKLSASQIKNVEKQEIPVNFDLLGVTSEPDFKTTPENFAQAPNNPVDQDQMKDGVNALFEYVEKITANQTQLFDEEQPIFLQIACIKVPNTPNRQVRLNLQHSLLTDSSEICLIVRDVGKPKEHEETIEHFEQLLSKNEITNIKTIMPYHQFKTEYGNQYELKRKLLGLYDYFLVDARVGGYVTHLLGKIFLEKRKMPTPISMEIPNLKEHIDNSLRKTLMKIHAKGDSYQVQIGHTKMSREQVFENVVAIADELSTELPGGLDNLRSLGIKTNDSLTVPIYLSCKSKNTVPVPLVIPKRPKAYTHVTGELTTFNNREITVLPRGKLIIRDTKGSDDEGLQSGNEEPDNEPIEDDENEFPINGDVNDEEAEVADTKEKQNKKTRGANKVKKEGKVKEAVVAEEATDEKQDILDQAEEMYLNEYEQEQISTRKTRKAKAGVKKFEDEEVRPKKSRKTKEVSQENVKSGKKRASLVASKISHTGVIANKKVTKAKTAAQGNDETGGGPDRLAEANTEHEQVTIRKSRKAKVNKDATGDNKAPAKKTRKAVNAKEKVGQENKQIGKANKKTILETNTKQKIENKGKKQKGANKLENDNIKSVLAEVEKSNLNQVEPKGKVKKTRTNKSKPLQAELKIVDKNKRNTRTNAVTKEPSKKSAKKPLIPSNQQEVPKKNKTASKNGKEAKEQSITPKKKRKLAQDINSDISPSKLRKTNKVKDQNTKTRKNKAKSADTATGQKKEKEVKIKKSTKKAVKQATPKTKETKVTKENRSKN